MWCATGIMNVMRVPRMYLETLRNYARGLSCCFACCVYIRKMRGGLIFGCDTHDIDVSLRFYLRGILTHQEISVIVVGSVSYFLKPEILSSSKSIGSRDDNDAHIFSAR
jgi:hypothetical protein